VKFECGECGKQFSSAGTLKQHAVSKRHNPQMKRMAEGIVAAEKKKPQVFVRDAKRCLFCGLEGKSVDENEAHMCSEHSFFVAQR